MPYSFRNREKLTAPQRYEGRGNDEDSPRPISYEVPSSDDEVYAPVTKSSRSRKYRGKIVQYNPNLPPAAFPTLDIWRQEPTSEYHDKATPSNDGSQDSASSAYNSAIEITKPFPKSIHHSNRECMHFEDIGAIPPPPEFWLKSLRARRERTPQVVVSDNPVWMAAAGDMSEPWEIEREMKTSEEDDGNKAPGDYRRYSPWDDLPVSLRLHIFDVFEERNGESDTYLLLQLNRFQIAAFQDEVERQDRLLKEEEARLESCRNEMHHQLLTQQGHISEEMSHQWLEDRLYRYLHDHETCTRGQMRAARRFVARLGLDPELIGCHWKSIEEKSSGNVGGADHPPDEIMVASPMPELFDLIPSYPLTHQMPMTRPDASNGASDDASGTSETSSSPIIDPSLSDQQEEMPHDERLTPGASQLVTLPSIRDDQLTVHNLSVLTEDPSVPKNHISSRRPHPLRLSSTAEDIDSPVLPTPASLPASASTQGETPHTPTTPSHTNPRKRRGSSLETSFLTRKRGPGARQPKFSEKVGRNKKADNASPPDFTTYLMGTFTEELKAVKANFLASVRLDRCATNSTSSIARVGSSETHAPTEQGSEQDEVASSSVQSTTPSQRKGTRSSQRIANQGNGSGNFEEGRTGLPTPTTPTTPTKAMKGSIPTDDEVSLISEGNMR